MSGRSVFRPIFRLFCRAFAETRHGVAWLFLVPALLSSAPHVQAAQINSPIVTSLTSTTEHMISYRHQEHSWQTSDGGMHVLINRGEQAGGDALALFSSHDEGWSWAQMASLPKSGATSAADGSFGNNTLTVAYSSNVGDVRATAFKYDPALRTWRTTDVHKVPRASKLIAAFNPTQVTDRNKNGWIALVESDLGSGESAIRLYRRAAGTQVWEDTGLSFGPRDALSVYPAVKRSARLVLTPGGIGMIYTVREQMFWAERPTEGAAGLPWTLRSEPLYTSPYPPDDEPLSSHFSTLVDDKGYLHTAMADGGRLIYQRYDAVDLAWSAPKVLTGDLNVTYPQITWIGGAKIAIVVNVDAMARVFQAADRGQSGTFYCTHRLEHPVAPIGSGIDYGRPRIEMPSKSRAPVPVFQQFETQNGAKQRALLYQFDAAAAAACQ